MIYGNIMDVRALTGVNTEDISDEDLSAIVSFAKRLVFGEIAGKISREYCPNVGVDKSVYQVSKYPIADKNGDGVVDGKDIIVEAKSSIPSFDMWRKLTVDSVNYEYGLIKLLDLPNTNESVFISYWYIPETISREDLDDLVNLLSAHIVSLRLQNPDTLTISDLEKNALTIKMNTDRFYQLYKAKKKSILGRRSFRSVI